MTGRGGVEWLAPATLEEALALRAERGEDSTVVAGGSFIGILMNQGFLQPTSLLSLRKSPGCAGSVVEDGELRLGAMTTHRDVERDEDVRRRWPVVARALGWWPARGCATRRRSAACWPTPTTRRTRRRRCARSAPGRAALRVRGRREVPVDELILGFYETCIAPDELLTEVRVPAAPVTARLPEVPLTVDGGSSLCGGGRRPDGR